MRMLPFDAHNHIHMGPSPPHVALGHGDPTTTTPTQLGGLAIMSTHPRDFAGVLQLSETLPANLQVQNEPAAREEPLRVVPCLGIHPWWLAELSDDDWAATTPERSGCEDNEGSVAPRFLVEMETLLVENPHAIVGEIGLDGFHFDPDTRELSCPMETQVEAFELQMQLAARLQRPVSIHTVQCFGPLMDALSRLKKKGQMPPRMYFHAFGGKVGTVDQVLALCGRKLGQVYFGFAPVVNFRAPKTAQVMQKVGLERLVLETDHEDATFAQESIQQCISYIAETFGVDERTVIETTTRNAHALYGLS